MALVSLAGLFALSIDAQLRARYRSYATVLAQQRVEQLRLEAALGPPVAPLTGEDQVDLEGRVIAGGQARGFVFVRRWRVDPLAADPARLVAIDVEAGRPGPAGLRDSSRIATLVRRSSP
jgi:hypothetical protein